MPKVTKARSITWSEAKSVPPEVRALASHSRRLRASAAEEMRQAPVSASVTSESGAAYVTSADCKAACSRKSSVSRRLISKNVFRFLTSVFGLGFGGYVLSRPTADYSMLPDLCAAQCSASSGIRAKTRRACMTEVKCFIFKVGGLHLDR